MISRTREAHIFPRSPKDPSSEKIYSRNAEIGAATKSAGLRNKTFLQRDKFITKITAIERRGRRGGEGRDGRRESGARTAGDLDTLERFVAPGGTERAIVISRGGAWKRLRLRFPISRTRNHD